MDQLLQRHINSILLAVLSSLSLTQLAIKSQTLTKCEKLLLIISFRLKISWVMRHSKLNFLLKSHKETSSHPSMLQLSVQFSILILNQFRSICRLPSHWLNCKVQLTRHLIYKQVLRKTETVWWSQLRNHCCKLNRYNSNRQKNRQIVNKN